MEFITYSKSSVASTIPERVSVLTTDGRYLLGTLKGFDQKLNVILSQCEERVFGGDGVEVVDLGVYVVRGESVWVEHLETIRAEGWHGGGPETENLRNSFES